MSNFQPRSKGSPLRESIRITSASPSRTPPEEESSTESKPDEMFQSLADYSPAATPENSRFISGYNKQKAPFTIPHIITESKNPPFIDPHTAFLISDGPDRGLFFHVACDISGNGVIYLETIIHWIWTNYVPFNNVLAFQWKVIGPPAAPYPLTKDTTPVFDGPSTIIQNSGELFFGWFMQIPRILTREEIANAQKVLPHLCKTQWYSGAPDEIDVPLIHSPAREREFASYMARQNHRADILQRVIGLDLNAQTHGYEWGQTRFWEMEIDGDDEGAHGLSELPHEVDNVSHSPLPSLHLQRIAVPQAAIENTPNASTSPGTSFTSNVVTVYSEAPHEERPEVVTNISTFSQHPISPSTSPTSPNAPPPPLGETSPEQPVDAFPRRLSLPLHLTSSHSLPRPRRGSAADASPRRESMLRHFTLPGSDAGSDSEVQPPVQSSFQVGRVGRVDGDEDVGSEDLDGRVSPKDKNSQTTRPEDAATSEDHRASQIGENGSTSDRGDERLRQEDGNGNSRVPGGGEILLTTEEIVELCMMDAAGMFGDENGKCEVSQRDDADASEDRIDDVVGSEDQEGIASEVDEDEDQDSRMSQTDEVFASENQPGRATQTDDAVGSENQASPTKSACAETQDVAILQQDDVTQTGTTPTTMSEHPVQLNQLISGFLETTQDRSIASGESRQSMHGLQRAILNHHMDALEHLATYFQWEFERYHRERYGAGRPVESPQPSAVVPRDDWGTIDTLAVWLTLYACALWLLLLEGPHGPDLTESEWALYHRRFNIVAYSVLVSILVLCRERRG